MKNDRAKISITLIEIGTEPGAITDAKGAITDAKGVHLMEIRKGLQDRNVTFRRESRSFLLASEFSLRKLC